MTRTCPGPNVYNTMKLSDLDPCLWQYEHTASSSTFDFPDLQTDTFAELKPLPPFDYGVVGQSSGGSTTNSTAHTLAQLQQLQAQQQQQQQQQQQLNVPATCYDVSTTTSNIKTELAEYLLTSDIDDIAALIGNAIAEQQPPPDQVSSSTLDPWTELDAWIQTACQQTSLSLEQDPSVNTTLNTDSTFSLPSVVTDFTFGNNNNNNNNNHSSPILQARYAATCFPSKRRPGAPFRNLSNKGHHPGGSHHYQLQSSPQMPESTSNYPHIKVEPCYNVVEPHVSPTVTSTSARFKKSSLNHRGEQKLKKRKKSPPSIDLGSDKEKPIHRCGICNRGFLNKSNIKVHLRTHTGEKPFKCETCGKAFRQKAHLLKHVQIHKRIPRD